jgi:hypothetical protein
MTSTRNVNEKSRTLTWAGRLGWGRSAPRAQRSPAPRLRRRRRPPMGVSAGRLRRRRTPTRRMHKQVGRNPLPRSAAAGALQPLTGPGRHRYELPPRAGHPTPRDAGPGTLTTTRKPARENRHAARVPSWHGRRTTTAGDADGLRRSFRRRCGTDRQGPRRPWRRSVRSPHCPAAVPTPRR